MSSRPLNLDQALAFDKLEEFVRQEEARGAELVKGSDFERALALLITRCRTGSASVGDMAKDKYEYLSGEDLERIRRFVEETDIDVVTDDLRELVKKHWPWLLPKLSGPTRQ